jgi:hypothetical protein
MDHDDRGCNIEYQEGKVTLVKDFKDALMRCALDKQWNTKIDIDEAIMQGLGFVVIQKKPYPNICKSCRQLSESKNGHKCCPEARNTNRTKAPVILNMTMSPVEDSGDSAGL